MRFEGVIAFLSSCLFAGLAGFNTAAPNPDPPSIVVCGLFSIIFALLGNALTRK